MAWLGQLDIDTDMYLGGAGMGVLAYLVRQRGQVAALAKYHISNEEAVEGSVILADLFFGNRMSRPMAGIMDGAVAGAAALLVKTYLDGRFTSTPVATGSGSGSGTGTTTGYQVGGWGGAPQDVGVTGADPYGNAALGQWQTEVVSGGLGLD